MWNKDWSTIELKINSIDCSQLIKNKDKVQTEKNYLILGDNARLSIGACSIKKDVLLEFIHSIIELVEVWEDDSLSKAKKDKKTFSFPLIEPNTRSFPPKKFEPICI